MATLTTHVHADRRATSLLRAAIVALTLTTAAIHASLGSVLFLANALGYAALAAAMIMPGPFARLRWLVRLALAAFTAGAIGAWLVFGARFPLAYLDKGLEVGLIVLLAVELWQIDGGPAGVLDSARDLLTATRRRLAGTDAR